MLVVSIPIGGFIAALLFYSKPELALIHLIQKRRKALRLQYVALQINENADRLAHRKGLLDSSTIHGERRYSLGMVLDSPFLTESRAYATGAFYFSISMFLGVAIVPFSDFLKISLTMAAFVVLARFLLEARGLTDKILDLTMYYSLYQLDTVRNIDMRALVSSSSFDWTKLEKDRSRMKEALVRGDWVEADTICDSWLGILYDVDDLLGEELGDDRILIDEKCIVV